MTTTTALSHPLSGRKRAFEEAHNRPASSLSSAVSECSDDEDLLLEEEDYEEEEEAEFSSSPDDFRASKRVCSEAEWLLHRYNPLPAFAVARGEHHQKKENSGTKKLLQKTSTTTTSGDNDATDGETASCRDPHLNVTLSLFDLLLDSIGKGKPLVVAAQAFGILASQQPACDSALRLCCYRTLRSTLCTLPCSTKAVSAVWSAMERYLWSPVVQIEACKLLQRLLMDQMADWDDQDVQGAAACAQLQRRGLNVLFRVMHWHVDHAMIQCLALDLIRRLKDTTTPPTSTTSTNASTSMDGAASWYNEHDNEPDDTNQGALLCILQALQRHPRVPNVQQMGLMLLAWLTEDADCRELVVRAGGATWIPDIMRLHRHDALIQCNAAAALCWILHAGGQQQQQQPQPQPLQQAQPTLAPSDIPVVLDILRLHCNNASTFGNCVCLLCALPTDGAANNSQQQQQQPQFSRMWDEQCMLELVLAGMQQHVHSAKVQEGCLRWLRSRDFFRHQQNNNNSQQQQQQQHDVILCERLEQSIPVILRAMHLHQQDAHLQAQALDVLVLYSDQPVLRQAMQAHGAVDYVLRALKQHHATQPRIQQGASWFLTVLMLTTASESQPATTAFGGGGVDVLETIWKGLGIVAVEPDAPAAPAAAAGANNNNNNQQEERPQEEEATDEQR